MASSAPGTAVTARARIRAGEHAGPTSGLAPGYAQANLVVLPVDDALDFLRFCVRNPKPCPVLEVTDTGSARPELARTGRRPAHRPSALPRFPRRGTRRRTDRPRRGTGATTSWHFCSGVRSRSNGRSPPPGCPLPIRLRASTSRCTSRTAGASAPGRFEGPLVVSMRPFTPRDIPCAAEISARFPAMHGGPVHVGDPAALGIADLDTPDYGDPVRLVPARYRCSGPAA